MFFSKTILGLFICFLLSSVCRNSRLVKGARSTAPGDQSTSLSKKQTISAYGVFHLKGLRRHSLISQAWCSGQVPQICFQPLTQRAHTPGEGPGSTLGCNFRPGRPLAIHTRPPASATQADRFLRIPGRQEGNLPASKIRSYQL